MVSLRDAEYFYDEIFGINTDGSLTQRQKLIKLYDISKEFIDLILVNDSRYFSNYYSMFIYVIDKYKVSADISTEILRFRSFAATFKRDKKRSITNHNINFGIHAIIGLIDFFTEQDDTYYELNEKLSLFRNTAQRLEKFLPDFRPVVTEQKDFLRACCTDKRRIEASPGVFEDVLVFETGEGEQFYLLLNKNWADSGLYIKKGSTVNLLHIERNSIKADLPCYKPAGHSFIVFEPDYLVDITEIAECFVHNGCNKYISLVGRFKKPESKYSLLKGNIINSYLDQLVEDIDIGFDEAYEYAIRQKPVSMFALAINQPEQTRNLKSETYSHFENIRNALIELQYSEIIIEPTFISPKFGIQGRLDLLATDNGGASKNVIELKSGNAPDKDYSIVIGNNLKIKTGVWNNHSAQTTGYNLLLDSAYPDRSGSSGILYSSLDKENLRNQPNIHASKMEVIKLRNWLVAIDYALGNDAGIMLKYMLKDKPEANLSGFNLGNFTGFRLGYSAMNEITREYFEKFTAFIAREIRTVKTGEAGNSGRNSQSSLWLACPEEKMEGYNTITGLIPDLEKTDFNNFHIVFARAGEIPAISNIRKGDIVIIYPDSEDYEVTDNQVIKGYIKQIDNQEIRISLRNKQMQKEVFSQYVEWVIEADISDSINKKLYSSLYLFCTSGKEKIDTIFGIKEPEFEETLKYYSEELNEQQNSLLNQALSAKDYFIIQGPPGTGKTSKMLKSLVEILYGNSNEKILVAAYTNRAVDEICSKLKEIDNLEFLRLGSKESTEHTDSLIAGLVERESPRAVFRKLSNTRIIVSTIASLIYNPEIFEIIKFDTAIVDEASQILEPYMLPVVNNTRRIILIGDEKQLPAIVTQYSKYLDADSEKLAEISLKRLDTSLFERLLAAVESKGWNHAAGMLEYQARMDYEIQELANYMFYSGRLKSFDNYSNIENGIVFREYSGNSTERLLSKSKIVFIDVPAETCLQFKHNSREAKLAAEIACLIFEKYGDSFNEDTLGIIAPFRAQCAEIRSNLPVGIGEKVTVDTVERFQGSERDNIIISFSVNRAFELRNLSAAVIIDCTEIDRKLNVAITRAKKRLIMIGNTEILKQSPVYARMLEYLERKNKYSKSVFVDFQ